MELADKRGRGASLEARHSLREFKNKRKAEYRKQLEAILGRRVTPNMTDHEIRRLKVDQFFAKEELDALRRGESLSEYEGLLTVRRSRYVSEDPHE